MIILSIYNLIYKFGSMDLTTVLLLTLIANRLTNVHIGAFCAVLGLVPLCGSNFPFLESTRVNAAYGNT